MNHFSHDSISLLLVELHWLPILQRILYKILLQTHKAVHHTSPSFLTNLIPLQRTPITTTRSTNTFLIELPSKYKKPPPTSNHGQSQPLTTGTPSTANYSAPATHPLSSPSSKHIFSK